ncbi:HAD-like protein [Pseudovirgaria hyperparasitica]|uniref:Mitochondrial import inner membrane translocase subunit TIM50 n=1 Tax=Pseudovirgaria hyperparasitica TaxID=470096 RepID=A0A6A6VYA5_9PEZI|nr:HAD-like protein [Pseudovirgaria hyperparasitica]KAF2755185.1 HAD-like protein [Pseudovirgaria hyperparasitica]
MTRSKNLLNSKDPTGLLNTDIPINQPELRPAHSEAAPVSPISQCSTNDAEFIGDTLLSALDLDLKPQQENCKVKQTQVGISRDSELQDKPSLGDTEIQDNNIGRLQQPKRKKRKPKAAKAARPIAQRSEREAAKGNDSSAKIKKKKLTKSERKEKGRLAIEANRAKLSQKANMENGPSDYRGGMHRQGLRRNHDNPSRFLTGANATTVVPQPQPPSGTSPQQWQPSPQIPWNQQQLSMNNVPQATPYGQPTWTPPIMEFMPPMPSTFGMPGSASSNLFTGPTQDFNSMAGLRSTQARNFSSTGSEQGRAPAFKRLSSPKRELIPRPVPTAEYLNLANGEAKPCQEARKMLLVFDLNGTLVFRPNRDASRSKLRPGLDKFMEFVFANFHVMVWSSSKPENVETMCTLAFTDEQRDKLEAKWSRKQLRLSQQHYNSNVQVYKHLTWIFDFKSSKIYHPDHPNGGRWDATNTILIDDSALKSAAEPYNLIEIPEWDGQAKEHDQTLLVQLMDYLDEIRYYDNVASCIRQQPFRWDKSLAS